MSVTIAKLNRSSGIRFKAIIRDRSGRALRSRTFTKLGLARGWAKRIEADRELVAARSKAKTSPPRAYLARVTGMCTSARFRNQGLNGPSQ